MRRFRAVLETMKEMAEPARLAGHITCITILVVVLLFGACASTQAGNPVTTIGPNVPRTDNDFRDDPVNFHFVVIADNTGNAREGVLRRALKEVNLMEPAFVINIGDLIDGYTEDRTQLKKEWDEIDAMVNELDMPFFFVVGNHDMGNDVMLDVWRSRLGRDYYHFVYKNVLFLVLNTEDPPLPVTREIAPDVAKLREVIKSDPDLAERMVMEDERLQKAILYPKISDKQVEYFKQALADHPDVRWTFVLMHKPAWKYGTENFRKIQSMLHGRNYTVFGGHEHHYKYSEVDGRDYIQMATTGAGRPVGGPGYFDHFVWVTMTEEGPKIVNLLLDGLLDHTGKPITD